MITCFKSAVQSCSAAIQSWNHYSNKCRKSFHFKYYLLLKVYLRYRSIRSSSIIFYVLCWQHCYRSWKVCRFWLKAYDFILSWHFIDFLAHPFKKAGSARFPCVFFKQQLMGLITSWIDLCFNFMDDITQLSPDGIIGMKHCQRTLDTKEVSQCNPFSTVIIFVLASDICTEA